MGGMNDRELEALRYPIGPLPRVGDEGAALTAASDSIAALPARLRAVVEPLAEARLATRST
jgi:hypothetical protein